MEGSKGDTQHPLLDSGVAKNILKHLQPRHLFSARLVCKTFKTMSNDLFYEKTVTVLNKSPANNADKEFHEKLGRQTLVQNLRFRKFYATEVLLEKLGFLGQQLSELSLHSIRLNNCVHILRMCYSLMPNLRKLEIDCDGFISSEDFLPAFQKFPEIPLETGGGTKELKVKCFSLRAFHFPFETPKPAEGVLEELRKYLRMCPDLNEIKIDILSVEVLKMFVEGFHNLTGNNCTASQKITHLSFALYDGDTTELLTSFFKSSPLQNLKLSLHIPFAIWPQVFQNLPSSTLKTLQITQGNLDISHPPNSNSGPVWFQDLFCPLGWNNLENLCKLELQINYPLCRFNKKQLLDSKQSPLEKVTDLKWTHSSLIEKKGAYSHFKTLFPNLRSLNVRIDSRKELMELVSSFWQLEQLEIHLSEYYTLLDEDVLGYTVEETSISDEDGNCTEADSGGSDSDSDMDDDWKGFEGLRGLKGLRRLSIAMDDGCHCRLTDRSVFGGFLYMPNLKILEFSSFQKIKCFKKKARLALMERNINLCHIKKSRWSFVKTQ